MQAQIIPQQKPAQILVVDDEQSVARIVQRQLESLGYEVPCVAASADEAFRLLSTTHIDLIVMDIHINGAVDGIQAAKFILSHFNLPVVYLSGSADDLTTDRANVSGAYGFVFKPFDRDVLHQTVKAALRRHAGEEAADATLQARA